MLSRRTLLGASLAAAPIPAWARAFSPGAFTHGVASGDPLSDRIILWTRFAPGGRIGWEIAEDESFARIAARGEAEAAARNDYCVKVDAGGLAPGRRYFYRFLSASGPSVTGRTLTAPERGGEALNIALMSCANLRWGYFHGYGHAAEDESVDLVLHVGDYIYEFGRETYPGEADALPGRIIEPAFDTVSFNDYAARYASYHLDPDLLELRRLKPICAIWDDHEIADNVWRDGALNHSPNQGPWSAREAAAIKTYYDWMPVRPQRSGQLYRALDWGDLARIILLDTRIAGRDHQLTAPRASADAAAIEAFRAELNAENRSMLGPAQERWFAEALARSKSRGQSWQIIAQQILAAEHVAPPALESLLPPSSSARAYIAGGVRRSAQGLPWNMDSWAGYPAARRRFLNTLAANANNAMVLAGDSHNCWLSTLNADDRVAALEFAGGSISSPGLERSLSLAQDGERERLMQSANPQLNFCDLTRRGYGALRFTSTGCDAAWIGFDSVRTPARGAPVIARLHAEASANGPYPWRAA